jgi:ATP-dependent helicase HrpB
MERCQLAVSLKEASHCDKNPLLSSEMTKLPIDSYLPSIVRSIQQSQNTVLTASPGAGKTTRLPAELLSVTKGQILVLAPRRMAAFSACIRVCEERGWQVGIEAGYQVRFESRKSPQTRLIYMTDALLIKRMIDDPNLVGVDLVVIDEFHERNLHQDLLLASLRELQELGSSIKILVMSATLDVQKTARFLGDSTIIDVPGNVYPLNLRYSKSPLSQKTDREFFDRVWSAISTAASETKGDILVFLPGTGEISRLQETLSGKIAKREIVALHGSLPLAAQQKVLAPAECARIILATNVAEASVTVEGVDWVIDTGLARMTRINSHSGFTSLDLNRISQFSARQRAGRAARQGPGTCVRLWTQYEEQTQVVESVAECQRVDLSSALLWLAHQGIVNFKQFLWFEIPPLRLIEAASIFLKDLGALDTDGRINAFGKKLVRYPLPPRLGALLALGDQNHAGSTAAQVAAILSERDFLDFEETHANTECDILHRLDLLRERRGRHVQSVIESAKQMQQQVGFGYADDHLVKTLLLQTHADRLCRRRTGSDRALMIGGRGVRLHKNSQVRHSEFFVALQGIDLPGQPDTSVSIASGFSKDFLLEVLKNKVSVHEDIYFDEEKRKFYMRRTRQIADLIIEEPVLGLAASDQIADQMVEVLLQHWDWIIAQHLGLKEWIARWRFLESNDQRFTSELSHQVKRKAMAMASKGCTSVLEVLEQDLVSSLEANLSSSALKVLRTEVPSQFSAPSGVAHKILYEEAGPFVEIRLQEIFGLLKTPMLMFGRVPITFRLLGPNFRPVQITRDLEGFWRGTYLEVRKELRARYPKHSWPEEPLSAKPEAKGRRR